MSSALDRQKIEKLLVEKLPSPSSKQYIWLSKQISKKSYSSLLEEGLRHHPFNRKLTGLLNRHYEKNIFSMSQFKRLVKNILKSNRKSTYMFYKECTTHLHKSGYIEEAFKLAKQGITENPEHQKYLAFVSKFAMKTFNWSLAIQAFEQLLTLKESAALLFDLAVCYEIIGRKELAEPLYSRIHMNYNEEYDDLFTDYYRKYTLFNNGFSKIEFYKNIVPNEEVVATFDTITKTWEQIPFAYNAIKKRKKDIIALRRHSVHNFHQDLSREHYWEATKTIFTSKEKKYAYGTSLGGYCALYFGSLIPEVKILAMAPRNSAHPSYGSTNIEQQTAFQHISPHPLQKELDAVIMYDHKNAVDEHYLVNEVFPSYPTAKIMTIPYAGHRIPKFLSQTGQLKSVVSKFFTNKKIPAIKRGDLRYKSSEYFWVLAEKSLEHQHGRLAIDYACHAIHLDQKFDRPYATRIQAAKELQDNNALLQYTKAAYEAFPEQIRFILTYTETLVAQHRTERAIEIIEQQLTKKKDKRLRDFLKTLQY